MTGATTSRHLAAASFAIATIFLAVALPLLPDYGPTFDAVLGDYAFGEYLLEYLRTGDEAWLRFEPGRLADYGVGSHPEWRLTFPLEYIYPVPSILSAVGCRVFAQELGWLHPIDAHHLVAPVSFAILLACLFRFVASRAGVLPASFAVLSLALHPHLFGHAMNDIKDAPTLLLVFLATWAYARNLETGKGSWFFIAAALTGIGLASKINAVWPAGFFALVWIGARLSGRGRSGARVSRVVIAIGIGAILCIGAYVACSPQYRVDGFERFMRHLEFMTQKNTRVEGKESLTLEPFKNLFANSPLPLLPLALIGLVVAWRGRSLARPVTAYFVLLATIPVVRPCLPGMRYYNLVRHFLEVFPILAIFAGIGLASIAAWVAARIGRGAAGSQARSRVVTLVSALLVFAPQVHAVARSHPWQTAWFNSTIGGLAGAQAKGIADADDYWCHSCRAAVAWLDRNADAGALILDPFAPWMIGALRKTELRSDLVFAEADEAVELLVANGLLDPARDRETWERAKIVIVTYVPQTRRFNQRPGARTRILEYCERELEPWHVIRSADGGEIVRFYRIETTR